MAIPEKQFLPALSLVSHREPFLFLSRFKALSPSSGLGVKVFEKEEFGVGNGQINELVLVEGLAQTVAAIDSFNAPPTETLPIGYLVVIQRFEFLSAAVCDEEVEFEAHITGHWGRFSMATGEVRQKGISLARGQLQFYTA